MPSHVVNAAVHGDAVESFEPTFAGPASLRDPAAEEPSEPDGVDADGDDGGKEDASATEYGGTQCAGHASKISDLPAETLI